MDHPQSGRRYEVTALRGKRWIIDCLARSEVEARARAEALYADESVAGVRVVRARFGRDGTSFETQLLEQIRTAKRGEAPVRIAAASSEDAWCESLEDCYGPASRRAIARLLRNFLDRYCITPTELLHHHRYIRLLERQDNLGPQAVQRIAQAQARTRGLEARARLDVLDRFVSDASARARDALASRAAPRLGEDGLGPLAERVAEAIRSPADQGFYIRYAVSRAFEDLGGFGDRLEKVMGWAETALPETLVPLVDELVAGILGAASFIQESLGPQSHLAGALTTLADLAAGRLDEAKAALTLLAPLARLMRKTAMPETRLVLLDRLRRELASEKPLSRDDATGQRRLFEGLLDRLLDDSGLFVGGTEMVEAIARRSRRFDIVGGVEPVSFATDDPAARLEQLLEHAGGILGERQQQAVATCLADVLECFDGDAAVRAATAKRIEALALPDAAKAALGQRLARRPPAEAKS
jgi:hypothetical protein